MTFTGGWGFSTKEYSGDTNGIHFLQLAADIRPSRLFSLRTQYLSGYFTDQPVLGRLYLKPLSLGLRAHVPPQGIVLPYVEMLGTFHDFGNSQKPPFSGFQAGIGTTVLLNPKLECGLGLNYLYSEGWSEVFYDASDYRVPDVRLLHLTTSISFRIPATRPDSRDLGND